MTSHEQTRSLLHDKDLAYLIVTLIHRDASRSAASHPLQTGSSSARPGQQHDDAVLLPSRAYSGLSYVPLHRQYVILCLSEDNR